MKGYSDAKRSENIPILSSYGGADGVTAEPNTSLGDRFLSFCIQPRPIGNAFLSPGPWPRGRIMHWEEIVEEKREGKRKKLGEEKK